MGSEFNALPPSPSMASTGCFTGAATHRDGLLADHITVASHFIDRWYIKYRWGNHHRIDNGYRVSGEMVKMSSIQKRYSGIISGEGNARIGTPEFNAAGTVAPAN